MNKTLRMALMVAFAALIVACAIVIGDKLFGRAGLDLTQQKLFTLSKGTRNIISKLQSPVHLKLYYASTAAMKGPEEIRYYSNYFRYTKELLQEYVALSKGMLTLDIVDPRPFSKEEDEAEEAGINRFPITQEEGFYFGLVAKTEVGKDEVIPFFQPTRQQFIEYDITKAIDRLMSKEKRKVGLLSSLPVMGEEMDRMMMMMGKQPQSRPWGIAVALQQEYEVIRINPDAAEIKGVDFLMVVHPKELQEKTLFAIDQYVMGGGKMLVFVDPFCLMDKPPQDPNNPFGNMSYKASSNLNKLLSKWGVEMDDSTIVCDREMAIERALRQNDRACKVLPFLAIDGSNVNKAEVPVSELHNLTMLFAGALKPTSNGATYTPLITTSAKAALWKPEPMDLLRLDPQNILKKVTDGTEKLTLACRLSGKFKSAFPEGIIAELEKPKDEKGDAGQTLPPVKDKTKKTGLTESTGEPQVIVVGDVDMISDILSYQELFQGMLSQQGENPNLVLNSIDFLAGSQDLISVRCRGEFKRPFDVVDSIQAEEDKLVAGKEAELDAKIDEMNQKLQAFSKTEAGKNRKMLKKAVVDSQREAEKEIRDMSKKKRELKANSRGRIEALGNWLKYLNILAAPLIILAIAIALWVRRQAQARAYLAKRNG